MVKSAKKALVICMAAAMMMSSVTGCSGGGAKADASPTTEAVTEAKQEEAEVTEADSGSGEADESDEDSEDVEYSFSTPDGEEIGDAEDPGCNEASMMIEDLKSPVTSENRGEYDYTDKAMEYLNYIGTNLKDRNAEDPEGSDHNKAVDWIKGELKAAGYTDDQIEDQETKSDGYNIHNIVLTIPGEDDSKQILAGAHYDGDGVGDNGSGTALLLANAVGLKDKKPHYTTKLIFFDAEEMGLYGSSYYADNMTQEEIDKTLYMINIDAIAVGDYANVYGGLYTGQDAYLHDESGDKTPPALEAYNYAMKNAKDLGIDVQGTKELDGYYQKNGTGPEIKDNTLYTNPWTAANPAPKNSLAFSPATIPASDHVGFMTKGIEYIYFEATNWFAGSDKSPFEAYTGYLETYDESLGENGMFMNTEYDTLDNLNTLFPGRAEAHFHMYSPLLSALLLSE